MGPEIAQEEDYPFLKKQEQNQLLNICKNFGQSLKSLTSAPEFTSAKLAFQQSYPQF
jgi:hypothetical protein